MSTSWDVNSGQAGKMRMTDTGSTVELWVHGGYAATFWSNTGYSWSGVGGSGSASFGYSAGSGWVKVRTLTPSGSGNISWTVNKTGTSGFGGPTTQTNYISRGPSAVTGLAASLVTAASVKLNWNAAALNGGTLDFYQIQISSTAQSGNGDFAGAVEVTAKATILEYSSDVLKPNIKYYAHVRPVTNVWGPWCDIITFTTLAGGARVLVGGVWKDAIPYVKVAGVWKPATPYVKVKGEWKQTS